MLFSKLPNQRGKSVNLLSIFSSKCLYFIKHWALFSQYTPLVSLQSYSHVNISGCLFSKAHFKQKACFFMCDSLKKYLAFLKSFLGKRKA